MSKNWVVIFILNPGVANMFTDRYLIFEICHYTDFDEGLITFNLIFTLH